MTEPNEGVMSKIMKLLNLANDEGATPSERLLAEEQAERLMAKHMVDRFEAEQKAKRMGETVRKPVQETWEIHMSAYKDPNSQEYYSASEFDHHVIDMMQRVLKHCNVRVHPKYTYAKVVINKGTDNERLVQDTTRRVYTIVGFPEDIAYAERIWFNVFRTFVANVNPQWDVQQSLDWNAYNFASAGVSWKQQVLLAEAANDDRLEKPWRYQSEDRKAPFYSTSQAGALIDPGNEAWGRSIHKLKRACKKYCTDKGVDYPYAGGTKLRLASRASFARSYNSTIGSRLDEIRRKANDSGEVSGEKFALAIRDTEERVDEEFYRLFPEYDPEVIRRKQQEQERIKAVQFAALSPEEQARVIREDREYWERQYRSAGRARRNYRTVRADNSTRMDPAAWERGRKAAQSVNLRNDAEVRKQERKGIE